MHTTMQSAAVTTCLLHSVPRATQARSGEGRCAACMVLCTASEVTPQGSEKEGLSAVVLVRLLAHAANTFTLPNRDRVQRDTLNADSIVPMRTTPSATPRQCA